MGMPKNHQKGVASDYHLHQRLLSNNSHSLVYKSSVSIGSCPERASKEVCHSFSFFSLNIMDTDRKALFLILLTTYFCLKQYATYSKVCSFHFHKNDSTASAGTSILLQIALVTSSTRRRFCSMFCLQKMHVNDWHSVSSFLNINSKLLCIIPFNEP